jgi:hypothetical protein
MRVMNAETPCWSGTSSTLLTEPASTWVRASIALMPENGPTKRLKG